MSHHRDTQSRSQPRSLQQPAYVYEFFRKQNEIKKNEYQILKLLGEGGFAKCYRTRRTYDQKVFAIKAINLNERSDSSSKDKQKSSKHPRVSPQSKALVEANFLKICNHPNIVRYETHFMYDNMFYIVMEHCPNGSVGEMLKQRKTITQVEARYYIAQMVHGLMYLKATKIIHRDLKPANYLLNDNMELKIADFGLATEVKNGKPVFSNICGTPNYLSPEILTKKNYSYEVDVWSLGVAMYAMLCGMPPFETKRKEAKDTYEKIKRCDYSFNNSKVSISNEAKDLISKILVIDPSQRISLEGILDHPFMSSFNIPRNLSEKCLKKEPDLRFLAYFDFKTDGEQRGKSRRLRDKPFSKSNQDKYNKKAIRYCPPDFQKQQKDEKSFTKCEYDKFEELRDEIKMEQKKIISQNQPNQRESETLRPKSIGYVMKKLQKEQMLTSSPITSNSSIKQTNQNKYAQYPSQCPKLQRIEHEKLSFTTSNIDENIPEKSSAKDDMPSYESIQCEGQHADPTVYVPFPTYQNLMRPLTYQKGEAYDDYLKTIQMDWRSIAKANLKDCAEGRKSFRIVDVKGRSNKIQQQPNQGMRKTKILHEICSLQDFLVYTSSLYTVSSKQFKMVYCLKQQPTPNNQSLPTKDFPNQPTHHIGLIFSDNSSIITKLSQLENQLMHSSVYINNVNTFGKNFNKLYEEATDENNMNNYEEKGIADWFTVKLDLFDKEKELKSVDHQQSKKIICSQVNSELRMKIMLASTAIKLFKQTLSKHYPGLFIENKQNKSTILPKFEQITPSINDFKFISIFRSRESSLYFELNDGSKHFLEKECKKKCYKDLFRKSPLTDIKLYRYAIYFSKQRVGFLKDSGQEKFKALSLTEMQRNKVEKKVEPVLKRQANVKVLQDEVSESQVENIKKKVKLNEEESKSSSNRKYQNLQKNQNITQNQAQSQNNTTKNIFQKLCRQFKARMEMHYIRERDTLLKNKMVSDLKEISQGISRTGCEFRQNRFCRWEIENGKFELKFRKQGILEKRCI